jgi:hypothetical protein
MCKIMYKSESNSIARYGGSSIIQRLWDKRTGVSGCKDPASSSWGKLSSRARSKSPIPTSWQTRSKPRPTRPTLNSIAIVLVAVCFSIRPSPQRPFLFVPALTERTILSSGSHSLAAELPPPVRGRAATSPWPERPELLLCPGTSESPSEGKRAKVDYLYKRLQRLPTTTVTESVPMHLLFYLARLG